MSQYLEGTCDTMCPDSEIKMRTRERLLHFFEMKNGQKNVPDPGKVVKSFSRSAAGLKIPKKNELRTERGLQKTVEYLLKEISLDKRKPFCYVYDFVFDRLRAVRQEIVIQNFSATSTISLLEPIVMFLAYSRYRLSTESIENFDPKICEQHLQECLKRVLCCYDESTQLDAECTINAKKRRIFIESLYQVFNLGSTEALNRSISLDERIRKDSLFILAQSTSLHFFRNNYYRTILGINSLPHILCAIGYSKIQRIRRKIYQQFSVAYSSKQLEVPIGWLGSIVSHSSSDHVVDDCVYYDIKVVSQNKSAIFSKQSFNDCKVVKPSTIEYFVEQKLKCIYLPEIILLKKL